MNEVEPRRREQLLGTPAERRLPGGVQPLEVAVEARDAQHVEGQIEEPLVFVASLHQRGPSATLADLALDHGHEPAEVVLEDVVVRARSHRLDRRVVRDCTRDDDERDVALGFLHDPQGAEPTEFRQLPVGDDHVPGAGVQRGSHRRGGLDPLEVKQWMVTPELVNDELGVTRRVFDQEHAQRAAHRRCSVAHGSPSARVLEGAATTMPCQSTEVAVLVGQVVDGSLSDLRSSVSATVTSRSALRGDRSTVRRCDRPTSHCSGHGSTAHRKTVGPGTSFRAIPEKLDTGGDQRLEVPLASVTVGE